jgi:hypothetical protein
MTHAVQLLISDDARVKNKEALEREKQFLNNAKPQ